MAERRPDPTDLGLSPSLGRTWDSRLVRDPRVIVPIHVDALVVRQEGGTWADCRFRHERAGTSADRLPDPFTDRAPRPRGVHLHWAVPDALANVRAGDTAEAPALPDRWLVARVGPGPHSRRRVTAWVLDARAGTATPLEQWQAGPVTGKPLTALGPGEAAWSAYADNTVDRLGFHDPLTDVARGPLAYLVCGWYADPALDPLAAPSARDADAFEARLDALRWELDPEELAAAVAIARHREARFAAAGLPTRNAARAPGGAVVTSRPPRTRTPTGVVGGFVLSTTVGPTQSLFHGSVVGISWPQAAASSAEVGGPPPSGAVKVALGTTPGDAFATLVGADAELLAAFAHGALADIDGPDGPARVADRIHDAGFVSRQGGADDVRRDPIERAEPRPRHRKAKLRPPTSGAMWEVKVGLRDDVSRDDDKRPETPDKAVVSLPRPRWFQPADPVVAVLGCARSFKHGGDGRFRRDGKLDCRLGAARSIVVRVGAGTRVPITMADVLERPLSHGGLPPECDDLLAEIAVLDPGGRDTIAAAALARAGVAGGVADVAAAVEVDQTVWWALRRPDVAAASIVAHSAIDGRLPSPVAVRPDQRPWVPLHLDWEVEFVPAAPGTWSLGEIDYAPDAAPPATGERFVGRALLSPGAATALAQSLRVTAAQLEATGDEIVRTARRGLLDDADPDPDALTDLADRLESLDVLAGALEDLHEQLRRRIPSAVADGPAPVAPPGFVAFRSGFLRLTRLRLVDAFGQVVDLDPMSRPPAVGAGLAVADHPGVVALPPRFTAPARLQLRFADAAAPTADATLERGPVCGWLLPDHLDGAIEVFEADATPVGQLRAERDGTTTWEPAPGVAAAVGERPRDRVRDRALAGLVQALFEQGLADAKAGREPATTALMRVIDSTRWTVDPFGHVGEEHLALLLGHPIVVVAATLRLEVAEPATGSGVDQVRVPVRLGALTHWKDGLFAFVVDDDYGRVRVARAASELARPAPRDGFLRPIDAAKDYTARFADDVPGGGDTPVDHPMFDRSQRLWVVPNRTYRLLLLLEPNTAVHATTGLLPRKDIGLRREWLAPGLGRLAPTFRFGPVLRDPKQVRMPIPADLGGAWTWTHRADVDRWAEEPVVHAGHEALLPPDPAVAEEGWLRFTPDVPEET